MERIQQLLADKGMRELYSQRLTVQVRNIKSKNILSKVEIEEVMAYVSDELLNETPLQYSTATIGDTQNVEVEDNEINIRIVEHVVRRGEEIRVENEATCIDETIANLEGMDLSTTTKGTRNLNPEGILVLKRSREIFETKLQNDIPSVKKVDWKKTNREFELVNSAIPNVKTSSDSGDTKLLASAAFLVAEMLRVKTRQKSEKSRKEPHWKRRIENNVKTWRRHLSKLEGVRKGNHVLCEKDI